MCNLEIIKETQAALNLWAHISFNNCRVDNELLIIDNVTHNRLSQDSNLLSFNSPIRHIRRHPTDDEILSDL